MSFSNNNNNSNNNNDNNNNNNNNKTFVLQILMSKKEMPILKNLSVEKEI